MRILTISTYPIKNPQHGGQKRVEAIVNAYKKFAHVRHMAIFNRANYRDYTEGDVPLSKTSQRKASNHPLTSDIVCGQAIMEDLEVKKKVSQNLLQFKPDIIQVEQPYTYIGIKPLLRELGMNPQIIFSSHNVEGPMKREILQQYDVEEAYIQRAVSIIEKAEQELAQDSVLTAACTIADIDVHVNQGAQKTVLAMNGIAPIKTTERARQKWKEELAAEKVIKTVLFVASAHPPSIVGFDEMIGKGLGFLHRDERLVIAGGIGDYYKDTFKPTNIDIGDATFWMRALSCGRVSEDKLGALLVESDVIILPITEGGGSNLKTAEAVAANKKIVTTTHALRSFEWVAKLPNVWVGDNKKDFTAAVRKALDTPFVQRTTVEQEKADTVLWEHSLRTLAEEVQKL